MKPVHAIITSVAVFVNAHQLHAHEIAVTVHSDEGKPIQGAEVVISFIRPAKGSSETFEGQSGKDGRFSATADNWMGAFIRVSKNGFYDSTLRNVAPKKDHAPTLILRERKDPPPLFAKKATLPLESENQWLAFDLEAGDWVPPQGIGKSRDILFRFSRSFLGYLYEGARFEKNLAASKRAAAARGEQWSEEKFKLTQGKWDAKLEVSFAKNKEGITEETDDYLSYSELRMPHLAPESGYLSEIKIEDTTYSPSQERDDIGFFIRTRVREDQDGNIISANYAKINGDFELDARGELSFTYYFNPTPNDRNLEFAADNNLFGRLSAAETVRDP